MFLITSLLLIIVPSLAFSGGHRFHLRNKSVKVLLLFGQKEKNIDDGNIILEHDDHTPSGNEHTYIRFSRAFQRHVVYKCSKQADLCSMDDCINGHVIGSFMFLDSALAAFPNAHIVKLRDIAVHDNEDDHDHDHVLTIGGMGITKMSELISSCTISSEKMQRAYDYLESISSYVGHRKSMSPSQSIYSISPLRFAQHSPDTIHHNYNRVMDLLTRGRSRKYQGQSPNASLNNDLFSITKVGLAFEESVARTIISEFPQICLYDVQELEDRIRFLISPILQTKMEDDYYKMLRKGFGAGLTVEQATTAVKVVPQFLSIFYEDSRKPSMIFFYKSLQIPLTSVNEARTELSQYMLGCDSSDVCSFAYLHSLGVSWDQIRLLLDAFPTLTYADKEPSWDLIDTKIRSELQVDMLHYLRKRLQISNPDVHSMLKVHSRLSTYGIDNIKTTLDALQNQLGLSSEELKNLVIRMPSIIGIQVSEEGAPSTLLKKANFFYNEVNLTSEELRKAIGKMPSLLQYNLQSLRLKCNFLINDAGVPEESLPRIVSLAPVILGLSLEDNLKPTVAVYKERCNLSKEELGQLIVTCPALLSQSVKRKIEPCLTFLESTLFISTSHELGNIVNGAPRILLQGIETSLRRKVDMMEDAVKSQFLSKGIELNENIVSIEAAQILKSNPALLTTTNSILQSRIDKAKKESSKSVSEIFAKSRTGRKRKFCSEAIQSKLPNEIVHEQDFNKSENNIFDEPSKVVFSAMVSGQIFPRDSLMEVRGKRKAGGIAINFHHLSCENDINFEDAMTMSFGMIMPRSVGGSKPENKLALLGFPFLRPSRNRCDLYACHGALKLVLQSLKQLARQKDLRNTNIHVKIYTDSSYAWKYLKNSTQLLQWGSLTSTKEMNFDDFGPIALANPDLLIPLTNTMYRMTKNKITDKFGNQIFLGNIDISFLHSGDDHHIFSKTGEMNQHAYDAAKWQFSKG